jgi:hypothetical protein
MLCAANPAQASLAQQAPAQSAQAPESQPLTTQRQLTIGPAAEPRQPQAEETRSCAELIAAGEDLAALSACREEREYDPDSPELMRRLARLEFEVGDPYRSARLWQEIIDREGWSYEAEHARALATWRAGAPLEAETIMRQTLERSPTADSHRDLIDYLLDFSRCAEAAELAARAAEGFPSDCWFLESWGVAEACQEHDAKAAEVLAKAVAAGCPRYRWTRRGLLPSRLVRAEYRPLLQPHELVEGLRQLDDVDCQARFELLTHVMTPEVVPQVTDEVLERTRASLRFTGLGLLSQVGGRALPAWKRLLASDDFILRKHTLRRIREMDDPTFIPLVEKHLEQESLPKNRNLTRFVLGDLLLTAGESARGQALLEEIPDDDLLYPVARLQLSERAEERGDHALALQLIDQARAASPSIYVDPQRVQRLRDVLGLPAKETTEDAGQTEVPSGSPVDTHQK